jgi:hypothetical protein
LCAHCQELSTVRPAIGTFHAESGLDRNSNLTLLGSGMLLTGKFVSAIRTVHIVPFPLQQWLRERGAMLYTLPLLPYFNSCRYSGSDYPTTTSSYILLN